MRCSKCGADNREGQRFCTQCGSPFTAECPRCGTATGPAEKFCGACGAALGTPPAATRKSDEAQIRIAGAPAPENLEGERKTVTALFADIKGSTELEQDLDPEEARAIIDPVLKIMIDAARRYDGYVQNTGDGIFALFGAPIAHEDHPQRALHAALRMQQEIHRYGGRLLQGGRAPIEIRVGVNTGEVVLRPLKTGDSDTEYAPIGLTTNLASRMQAVARSGSVVVSEATRKLVEGYFQLKSIGPTKVKGVSEPVQVYEVTGLGPLRTRLQRSASRGLSRFVGRGAELDQMKRALASAKSGRGQVVAVVAEPGLGKSRLFYEFQALGHGESLRLETFSAAHAKGSAYLPLLELLRNYFQTSVDDDVGARREKIAGKVLMLDRSLEESLPYIFTLLEVTEDPDPLAQMNPETKRRRTLEAIKRLLLRESLNQPLILVFEDLHWVDEGTQALLNLLVESIGTARVLMLVNYRPEYSHSWGHKTFYTQLRLDPFGAETSAEMLNALLGEGRDLAALKRVIVEKTEGNPFFMEEIVQALFEQGALLRNGSVKLAKSLSSIEIPPTVQGVLASRIDRLPPDEKDLLGTLAVIGKEFSLELVRETTGKSDDSLLRMLTDLQAAEFVYEQPAFPNVTYVFKHALSQQVAYSSALQDRRKVLHARIGRALEAGFPATTETQPELIAHHFTEAGLAAEAIPYWQRAGERAIQRGANPEAIDYLRRGLASLEKLMQEPGRDHLKGEDEQRQFSILISLAEAQRNLGEHLEAQATLIRAAKLAQLLHSTESVVRAARELARMASWYGVAAEPAVLFLEDAMRTAPPGDPALRIKTLAALGWALAASGQRKAAAEAAREAVALARTFADTDLLFEALEGTLLAFQGPETIEQRFAYGNEFMQLWRANEHKVTHHDLTFTLASWSLFFCHLELGDMRAFDAELDTWIKFAEKWQEPFEINGALVYRAMRALMRGDFAASERLAEEASALGQRLQTQNTSGILALQMFTLRREQGRLKELEPVVRYFVQQHGAGAAWRPGLALIYTELGLAPEAREQFEILAQRDFTDIPRDALWMASMTYLTDVCNFLGDDRRAAMLYDLLVPFDGRNVVVGNMAACYGALSRYLGALATTLRRWDEAERHFEDALAMNTRMEAPPWLAHTQHQYAAMLLLRNRPGDGERAVELLHNAFAAARGLGIEGLAERVGAALAATRPHLS